jgi:hypothetical protein
VLVPKGRPPAIRDKPYPEIGEILRKPDVVARLREIGAEPGGGGAPEFASSSGPKLRRGRSSQGSRHPGRLTYLRKRIPDKEMAMPGDTQQGSAQSLPARSDAGDIEHLPVDQVLTHFAVQPDRGLSNTEASQRLAKFGPNALVEKEQASRPSCSGISPGRSPT